MWRIIALLIFRISGWKVAGGMPAEIKKAVVIAAPHTSNWDFIFSRAAFFILRCPMRFTIKKEWVDAPVLGHLLKSLGAVPVDRQAKSANRKYSVVDQMAEYYRQNEVMYIMIAPEGTRKYVTRWKSGFYHLAVKADVPVVMGYLDYQNKIAGIGPSWKVGDSFEEEVEKIKDFYRPIKGKYPEKGIR